MHHHITPDRLAQVVYQQAICPTGDPQDAIKEWLLITSSFPDAP